LYDFGNQPLAGDYPTEPECVRPAKKYPLELTQCGNCGLLQIVNLPPIEEVFHSNYRYSSSTVPGLVAHFVRYAEWLSRHVREGGRVFEFGCNDGVLLDRLRALGLSCAGIDASENVAALARSKGLRVDTGFLTEEYARKSGALEQYDIVTCSNVLAHIHDVHATLKAVRLLLKPGGLFAIEVHNGGYIIGQNQFDTIYHEHLTYFTEGTLRSLVERCGFEFISCESTAMHGGGLRCLARKTNTAEVSVTQIGNEPGHGCEYGSRDAIRRAIDRCKAQVRALYDEHGPLVGYGAAGRSQMFVNFTGSSQYFQKVYDDSPFRQGRYIVGTNIPIVEFTGEVSKCVVVLAWNYCDDIAFKVRGSSGRIVALLPEFRDL
jgi:SAM-dependent methyltransferase